MKMVLKTFNLKYKDNLSIQHKYSFIEDVKLNKSGNVYESPPIGYGDCATHHHFEMTFLFLP